jgi:hypothetical protein
MIPKEKWLELSAGTLRTGGGLLSLWDMLRFHADRFYSLISKLETVSRMSDTLLVQNDAGGLGKVFAKHVGELDQICADIGLVVSRKKLPEIFKVFERGMELYPGELSGMVAELNGRIRHELEDKYVFVLSAKNYERFEQLTPIFGADVDDAFPSSRVDLAEAGKCFALARYTASVMHLMRALETPLKLMASEFSVPSARDQWHDLIKSVEASVLALGTKEADRREFFSDAASQFRFFKDAWRNHVMHARAKYTEEEAEAIMVSVKGFMRQLSKRLRETP